MLYWLLMIAGAYLLGSIPFGLLIGKARGVDLRAIGSGNIGATNAGRVLGRPWGALCFVLDVAKGAGPTLAAGLVMNTYDDSSLSASREAWWVGVSLAAILGHVFPIWLGFRGGKGVATSLGALLALWPIATLPTLAAAAAWLIALAATRYVGLSSVIAAGLLPGAVAIFSLTPVWADRALGPILAMSCLLAALVIWRHRGNLRRTLRGTEPKLGQPVS